MRAQPSAALRRALGGMLALALVGLVAVIPSAAALPARQTTPTIPACGARSAADVTLPRTPPPTRKFKQVITSPEADKVRAVRILAGPRPSQDRYYLLLEAGRIRVYDADFKPETTLTIPALADSSTFALDPGGRVYAAVGGELRRFSRTGKPEWSRPVPGGNFPSVYGFEGPDGFRIGAATAERSYVFTTAGRSAGTSAVVGRWVTQSEATDNLVATGEGYVRVYSRDGKTQRVAFGTNLKANDPGPFHFYVLNGADQLADGSIVVSDVGRGLELFSPAGAYLGVAKYGGDLDGGVTGPIAYDSSLLVRDGQVYYPLDAGGGASRHLGRLAVADVRGYVAQPQGSPGRLGIGAGLVIDAPGNYVPAGQSPKVSVQFFPGWATVADGLTLQYTVQDLRGLRTGSLAKPTTVTPQIGRTGRTTVPIETPSTAPGFYAVDARLLRNGETIGADCLYFGIAPPGADLDPAALGEDMVAKVNLTAAFGQRLLRADFTFDDLLADDPKAPLRFPDDFDARWKQVADAAAARGVTLEVQIATGSEKEKKLVEAGTWGDRVGELVSRLKPYVTVWEPWNEPNTTFGDAADFATKIVRPAREAVEKADPDATFVAGGVLGVDLPYIEAMIAAGGLDGADALGVHPYTGHNRSFEEQGQLTRLADLRELLVATGHRDLPIWDTESGFWNSPVSSYYRQGDKLVRKVVLENSVGIDHIANFYLDGEYTVEGQHWALWEGGVTPGSLAMVNFAARTKGLVFRQMVPTQVPHAYAALYGPAGGAGTMLVAWTDEFDVDVVVGGVKPGAEVLDSFGAPVDTDRAGNDLGLRLSGSPVYVPVADGTRPTIAPRQPFGPNLALATAGGTASATSSTKVNPPARAVDGIWDTQGKGANSEGISAWIQSYKDTDPQLTVQLGADRTLDRVLVASQGIDSVQTGLRSYDVQLRRGDGPWRTVAEVRNQFLARNKLVTFPAQPASAIRLVGMSVNYSGYAYGLKPPTWPQDAKSLRQDDVWGGQTVVYELEAYGPGGQVSETPSAAATPSAEPAEAPPTERPTSTLLIVLGVVVAAAAGLLGAGWALRRRRS